MYFAIKSRFGPAASASLSLAPLEVNDEEICPMIDIFSVLLGIFFTTSRKQVTTKRKILPYVSWSISVFIHI